MKAVFLLFLKPLCKPSGSISSKPSATLQIRQKLNASPHKPWPNGQDESRNTLNNISVLWIIFLLYYFLSPTFITWIQFFLFLLPKNNNLKNPVVTRACRKTVSEEQSHKLSRKTHVLQALHAAFICSWIAGAQWTAHAFCMFCMFICAMPEPSMVN